MLYWKRVRLDKLNFDAYIYVYNVVEGVNSPANGTKRSGGGGSGVERPARYTKAMNHAYLDLRGKHPSPAGPLAASGA